jgi:biotin carboxyl carrier protein
MSDSGTNTKPYKWLGATYTYPDASNGGFVTLTRNATVQLTDEQAKSPRFDGKVAPIAVASAEPIKTAEVPVVPPVVPSEPQTTAPTPESTSAPVAPPASTVSREDAIRAALAGTVPQALTFVNSLAAGDLTTARKIEETGANRASVLKIIDGRIASATTKA